MDMTRRDFIKVTGLGTVGAALASFGVDMKPAQAALREYRLTGAKEFTTVCHFCACGCGQIGYVKDGKLIQLEGAVDSPVNRGGLCPKGLGYQVVPNSDQRPTKPLYRAPYSDKWEEISWEEAIDKAARAMKRARDEGWKETETIHGETVKVNRTDALGLLGGSQINNEEIYQLVKIARAMGMSYIDNQTRVCHSSTPPALSGAFGRGAMTNHFGCFHDAKLVWIEGSNMAECHPLGIKNVMEAKKKGAVIVNVDIRYTRTSKIADHFFQVRPGTDIAFLGAIINYIIQNKLYDEAYVRKNTNAAHILRDDFKFDDGIFSGYDEQKRKYNTASWGYALGPDGKPMKATDLEAPNTVFSRLKEHFSQYTLEKGEEISGCPADDIKKAAEIFAANRPGMMAYALGMTQHTIGAQNIRCFTIVQLLLGNIGVQGGGIAALRGQPNVQASTDYGIMFQYLPAYLGMPTEKTNTLAKWTDYYGTFRAKFLKNILKAWFGDAATPENDYRFDLLTIRNSSIPPHSIYAMFDAAVRDEIKTFFCIGQNPLVTLANLNHVYDGLTHIDTVIGEDIFLNETYCFWQKPGVDPKTIKTEVIFLPAASYLERVGSLNNSMRMMQWRMKGPEPVGDSKPDYEILDMLWKRIRELYADSTDKKDEVIKLLTWDYGTGEEMVENLMKECNGYDVATKRLLKGIGEIKDDGSTACGMWIFAGVYGDGNRTKRRGQKDEGGRGVYPEYAWVWPDNIHVLYNTASCDEKGQPRDPDRSLVWWDAAKGRWEGYDVPDVWSRTLGPDTPQGQQPFRMNAEGVGRLFCADYTDKVNGVSRDKSGTPVDGPLPAHYEPVESPVKNPMYKGDKAQYNPCVIYPRVESAHPIGTKDKFPYVLSSSGICEHWCSGTVTRNIPWLNELVKEPFVEISHDLAKELGVSQGQMVKVSSARGSVKVKAMVTGRAKPLKSAGETVHTVWMPYSWGFIGLSKGESTNYLTIDALEPNVQIQEFKACLVNIEKA